MKLKNYRILKNTAGKIPAVKKTAVIAVIILAAALIVSGLTGCLESQVPEITLSGAPQEQVVQNTISVTGQGSVKTIPDEVFVNISVVTEKSTTADAVSENSTILNQLISSLEGTGAENLKIQTIGYELSPLYDYSKENEPPVIYAYQVISTIEARTTDLEKIGQIIALATEKGAGRISTIGFDLSEITRKEAKSAALSAASIDANDKAIAIAGAMGLKIEKVIFISEGETFFPGPLYAATGLEEAKADAEITPPVIVPQEIEVTASLSITYLFGK
jgi:uncharacterized protein YggE